MTLQKQALVILILAVTFCVTLIGNKCSLAQTEIFFANSKLGSVYERQMVTDVLVDYMLLKNSLAKGKAADARTTTLTIIAVIADYSRSMDQNLLPDSKKFKSDLAALKEKVKKSTTLAEARANFSALNNSFIEFIKSYGLYNKTIYLYQCDGNSTYRNGYWLSTSMTDKMNPYFDQDVSDDCYDLKESWSFIYKFPENW